MIYVGGLGKAILYGLTLGHLILDSSTTIPSVVVFEEIWIMRGQNFFFIRSCIFEVGRIIFEFILRRERAMLKWELIRNG